jgi:hypothetical protein
MSLNPDQKLDRIRALLAIQRAAPDALTTLAPLADAVRDLDAHLSAGGIPPEAWREGPDAPADSGPWGWQGDPRADLDDREETPAPEGLSLFAHWSTAHEGINVEMDVPDDSMPLTIHVNDHIAFRRGAVDANIDTDDDTLAGSPYFGA